MDTKALLEWATQARDLLKAARWRIANKDVSTQVYKALDAPVVQGIDRLLGLDETNDLGYVISKPCIVGDAIGKILGLNRDPGCKSWLAGIDPEFVLAIRSYQPTGPQLQNYQLSYIWDALRDNRLIKAIKYVREHTSHGLKDSKHIVDTMYSQFFGVPNSVTPAETTHLSQWCIPTEFAGALRVMGRAPFLPIHSITSIWQYLSNGKFVDAVREYRTHTQENIEASAYLMKQVKDKFFPLVAPVLPEGYTLVSREEMEKANPGLDLRAALANTIQRFERGEASLS